MNRLARATVLAFVTVVALSGCIRYNVDMTLAPDDTASGSVVLAVQTGVGEEMGVASDDEALTQLFGESPFGSAFVEKDYAEGDWVGKSYSFDSVPIDELADLSDIFTITHEGDNYVVQGPDAPMTQEDLDQLPPGAESKLSITFPGEVTDTNGTVDGTTVTWNLFSATEAIHAEGKASAGSSGLPTALLVGGAIALLLIGAAVVVFLATRKRGSSTPAADAAPVADAPVDGIADAPVADAPVADAPVADAPVADAAPAPKAPRAPRKPKAPAAPPAAADETPEENSKS